MLQNEEEKRREEKARSRQLQYISPTVHTVHVAKRHYKMCAINIMPQHTGFYTSFMFCVYANFHSDVHMLDVFLEAPTEYTVRAMCGKHNTRLLQLC